MNTKNNKRKKDSQIKIEKVFIELIQTKELNQISITDICKKAKLNRTTFYSNYIDIYDLAEKIRQKMITEVIMVYKEERSQKTHTYNFIKLFEHIKNNQLFYKTYFKLNFDSLDDNLFIDINEVIKYYGSTTTQDYHITFFKAGLNAVIKKWLYSGCKESPEEIFEIIKSEYQNKN